MLLFNTPARRLFAGLLAAAVALPGAFAQASGNPSFTRNATVHDPAVIRSGSTYYVFGSHLASASSTDLMNWTQISTAVAAGNPLMPNVLTELAETFVWAQSNTLWAPDVFRLPDGRFAFYYNACKGDSPRSAMGLAVADSVAGPYRNVSVFLKSGMWGQASPDGRIYDNAIHPNVVDPAIFYDHTGKLRMVYGSYSGGIFIMTLDPSTGLPFDGQGYGKKLIGGNNSTIEGPFILYSPVTQYYYLFVTFGGLDAVGGYNVRMGRSRDPEGPYLDADGNDLTNVKGAPGTLFDNASIKPYGVKLMGNWQFQLVSGEPGTVSRGYVSPGGVSGFYDPASGKYILVFHTRFVGRGEQHEVRVHQMYMNADGWPVIAPHRFAHETLTAVAAAQIPGDYKLVNHGKDITASVANSTVISLAAGGAVTGSTTGTWQLTGDNYATLTLGGVTYRGVFSRQWDDENARWVLAFSAISNSGVAVWGSKVATSSTNTVPIVLNGPTAQTVDRGLSATMTVSSAGLPAPTYQWNKGGVAIAGATNATLTVASASAADAGTYTVTLTNSVGSTTSPGAVLIVADPPDPDAAWLTNLSVRTTLVAGQDPLIVGLTVRGGAKDILVRGIGPTLANMGVPGVIADPLLRLFASGSETPLLTNDNWAASIAPYFGATGAFDLTAGSKDAAFVQRLDGGYSIHAPATGAGTILIEAYDTNWSANSPRLINISARNRVGTGDNILIEGFAIHGTGSKRLLVRAVGPTLAGYGVGGTLVDPKVEVYRGTTMIASNDNWDPALAPVFKSVGAFDLATGSKDAAMIVTLPSGTTYTVQCKGADGGTGEALVEIYELR